MRRRLMLKPGAGELQPVGVNLIESSSDGTLNTTTGIVSTSNSDHVSNFIPVYDGYVYSKRTAANRTSKYCVYDADKNYIRGIDVPVIYSGVQDGLTFSGSDKYVRISCAKTGSAGSTQFEFVRTA